MKREKRLTVDTYRAIPRNGTQTFQYQTANDLIMAQNYAYRLGLRFDDKVTTSTDTEKLTLTVTRNKIVEDKQ